MCKCVSLCRNITKKNDGILSFDCTSKVRNAYVSFVLFTFWRITQCQLSAVISGLLPLQTNAGVKCGMLSVPLGHVVYLTCKDSQLR